MLTSLSEEAKKGVQDHTQVTYFQLWSKKKKRKEKKRGVREEPGRNCNKMLANTYFLHLSLPTFKGFGKFQGT